MDQKWGLRLVVNNTKSNADKLRANKLYNALTNTVWAWCPLNYTIENRSFLLREDFEIKWVEWVVSDTSELCEELLLNIWNAIISVDTKADLLKNKILQALKESWNILKTSNLRHIIPEIDKELLSAGIATWLLEWKMGELTPKWEQLAMDNLKKAYVKMWDKVRFAANWVFCREELEYELRKQWYEIRNEAITKLMLYEINKWCFYPKVLVLPFDYKPYNPFIVLVDYDEPVYPELKALRLFAFLDEY